MTWCYWNGHNWMSWWSITPTTTAGTHCAQRTCAICGARERWWF